MDTPEPFARFAEPHRAAIRAYVERERDSDWAITYFEGLVPQPLVEADEYAELPNELIRKCCRFKGCGNTHLRRDVDAETGSDGVPHFVYGYRRESNDDWFIGPCETVAEVVARVNDPLDFPVAKDS